MCKNLFMSFVFFFSWINTGTLMTLEKRYTSFSSSQNPKDFDPMDPKDQSLVNV